MRDRGITRPGLKAALATGFALLGAAAVAWSALDPVPGQVSAPPAARQLGIVALVVGALAALNFLYALILVRRLRGGENILAAWTVAPVTFARFQESERARKRGKNNWRGWRKDWPAGLPVIFSRDALLVGETYFKLQARGISRFTHVHIEHAAPSSVQFAMTLTVAGAGSQSRTARYRGHLRIPIADGAGGEAARIVDHFRRQAP